MSQVSIDSLRYLNNLSNVVDMKDKNKKTIEKETVEFKGIKYHRYPSHPDYSTSSYFRSSAGKGNPKLLHREIWKSHYGEIPAGYLIHHKDGNPLNNSIENMECISKKEHNSIHVENRKNDVEFKKRRKKHLDKIRDLTKPWHSSKEGLKWHKNHAKNVFGKDKRKKIEVECIVCAKKYLADPLSVAGGATKFCSNNCKSKHRRMLKLDFIDKKCALCGTVFSSNKYNHTIYCSNRCSGKAKKQVKSIP